MKLYTYCMKYTTGVPFMWDEKLLQWNVGGELNTC